MSAQTTTDRKRESISQISFRVLAGIGGKQKTHKEWYKLLLKEIESRFPCININRINIQFQPYDKNGKLEQITKWIHVRRFYIDNGFFSAAFNRRHKRSIHQLVVNSEQCMTRFQFSIRLIAGCRHSCYVEEEEIKDEELNWNFASRANPFLRVFVVDVIAAPCLLRSALALTLSLRLLQSAQKLEKYLLLSRNTRLFRR